MPQGAHFITRSRQIVAAVTAVIFCLIVASGLGIWLLYRDAIADTEDNNHRLAVLIGEQTTRSLQSVDLVLRELSDKIIDSGVHDIRSFRAAFSGREVHDALAKRIVNLPQTEAFTILDATGHIVAVSRQWPAPDYTLEAQGYFRYLAQTPGNDPYISEPGVSRSSGARTVFLARRLTAADGTFLGLVVAPILLDYFERFFVSAGFADGEGVTILRRDGTVLVKFPDQGVATGDRMPPKVKWYDVVAAGGGHYVSPGAFAAVNPSFVFVHPLTLYPLVVDTTRSKDAALANWRRWAVAVGLATILTTTALTLLLRALGRQISLIEHSQRQIDEQVETITASKARLAAQSARLENTLNHMDQGLIMVEASGRIVVCNRRALQMLDLPLEMGNGEWRLADVVKYQRERGEFASSQRLTLDPDQIMSTQATYERRRPNGTMIEVRTAPLADGGMVRTVTDVTARAAAEELLVQAASRDHLTGLANRNGFSVGLATALAAAQRSGTALALLCLDLDRFKAVNDKLGHQAGDDLLVQVAVRMLDASRAADHVARLGGDEFAIILAGADQAGAAAVCERLLEAIRKPYVLGQETVCIGVSIGLSIYPHDALTPDQLMRNADAALYQAKADGRNGWCAFASPDSQRERRRQQLEQEFRTAVEVRQFSLAFQPICDGATATAVGFEALLRWTSDTHGPVSPSEFIPLAERAGLIVPLGRWVIEQACAEAAVWAAPLRIAVNLSPAQFHDRDLPGFIKDVLSRTGLAASRLDLEVTEGLLLDDAESVVSTMQALRAMGIRMVLDDFGTAHSNLSYLRGFPFDVVKIDRSFLSALGTDPKARALVEAIMTIARALGLEVIGEGVETQEQLALLTHLQCKWIQGYLFGHPASARQTRELIWTLAGGQTHPDAARLARPLSATI